MFEFLIILIFLPFVLALVFLCATLWFQHPKAFRAGKIWALIGLAALPVNPISQIPLFEWMDNLRGSSMAQRARTAGMIGMDPDQVRELMGEPSNVGYYNETLTWEYKQIPFYWLGSNFQVFFRAGVVHNVEANDD